MSFIQIISPSIGLNPTKDFLPINGGSQFDDSLIFSDNTGTRYNCFDAVNGGGWVMDFQNREYTIGRLDGAGNNTYFKVNERQDKFELNGSAITAAVAGIPSGKFLIVWVNNIQYKINLLTV